MCVASRAQVRDDARGSGRIGMHARCQYLRGTLTRKLLTRQLRHRERRQFASIHVATQVREHSIKLMLYCSRVDLIERIKIEALVALEIGQQGLQR